MEAFAQVTDYLREKIKHTNVNNPKANTGCRILKKYNKGVPDIDALVVLSISLISTLFSKEGVDSAKGEAALTYTSHSIGREIAKDLGIELDQWRDVVRLGDLFVEALYNCDLVDLYYEQTIDSMHMIKATDKWRAVLEGITGKELMRGTSLDKPEDISKMMQQVIYLDKKPRTVAVIKEKRAADTHIIRQNKNETWLKSINKLQQMEWKIDKRVLKSVIAGQIKEPDTDDALQRQRYNSRVAEKDFIIKKADELKDSQGFYQYISADYRGRLYYEEPFLNFQGPDRARGILKFAEGKAMTEDGKYWLAIHTANSYNKSYSIDEIPEWVEADYKSYLVSEGLETISVDKFTLDDRVRWTNVHMEILVEAGETDHVFEEAEKPFALFAACLEWYYITEAESNNRTHTSFLPIPVDGSNNGWQHLGAMSKDTRTGKLVGLIPVEIQQDFYVQTAKELIKITTDEERLAILDKMPMKHIRKGISKRGSMTRAYSAGATKIGENMWLDCRTEGFDEKYGITEKHCLGFANDLIKAIDIVCPGPLKTMKYLQDLAQFEIGVRGKFLDDEPADKEFKELRKELNSIWDEYNLKKKSFKRNSKELEDWTENNKEWKEEISERQFELIEQASKFTTKVVSGNGKSILTWVTPSGFPVEYKAFTVKPVETISTISGYDTYNKKCQVKHKGQEATSSPNLQRYASGVSPNFIHSLDASHMSLVIANWAGSFGAVHDSFSTHACDVEDLIYKIKHYFVGMYDDENYFDRIRYQLTCNTDDVEQPDLGELDITEVKDSDYFFA